MKCPWLALVLVWPAVAAADPLRVRVSGELPFEYAELHGALALRTQIARPGARSLEAIVDGAAGSVHVNVAGRERDVGLDGARGVEAARLIAFAILDLAGDQLDPPGSPETTIDAPMPVRSTDHAPHVAIAVWGHSGSRNEVELEVGLRVWRGVRVIAAGGASTRTTIGGGVSTRAWPLRGGVAWRGIRVPYGELELRATGLAVFEHAQAAKSHADALLGGGASVAWVAPIGTFAVLAGAGVDGYTSQIDYQIVGVHAATTPRVTWWAGLGVAVELWR